MRFFNRAGQALMRLLNPTAPRNLPVGWGVIWLHRLALRLADRNSSKGKVPASYLQRRHYDADLAQRLIDDGQIITTTLSVQVLTYVQAMWDV
ncbi:hypothetical protein [uncultured Brevundimonas sp.]|uniref:hypothetical protein n=1 Tax=uncultured Brevundimonas sp. TaxID=213418 RepID=UPI0025FD118D|nr:hypothetical protein [uncultured Brevundimonas sp.]